MAEKVQAVCEDGTLRVVHQGRPDSFFSAPAKAKINGEKVFGFVTTNSHGVREFIRSTDQLDARKFYRRSIKP